MFGKSWRTSTPGITLIATGLADILQHWASGETQKINWQTDLIAILSGLGLCFAKDINVTGGSVMQPTPPEIIEKQIREQDRAGL